MILLEQGGLEDIFLNKSEKKRRIDVRLPTGIGRKKV
jgi:hypothetical protein